VRIKSPVVLGIILLVGTVALAQGDHKIEAAVDYSYVCGNPQNNNIIPTFSSSGGGGSIACYFTKYSGIEGEFASYGSCTHNFIAPPTYCTDETACNASAQDNLFTHNVRPIVEFRNWHFEPFVDTCPAKCKTFFRKSSQGPHF
jgi:hypothetical protein